MAENDIDSFSDPSELILIWGKCLSVENNRPGQGHNLDLRWDVSLLSHSLNLG
jgi:hypothetical protein